MVELRDELDDFWRQARKEPLRILVWGPGDPGPNAPHDLHRNYTERVLIQESLREEFRNAKVYFSEDPEMQNMTNVIIGDLLKEAVHAYWADLILVLEVLQSTSRGVHLELDHFVLNYPRFRDKIVVLLPDEYLESTGLVSAVYDRISPAQRIGYSQKEFREGQVATEMAVRVAYSFAIARLLAS